MNFVGGEPGLLPNIGDLVVLAGELGARASYVTNGLMLRRFDETWSARHLASIGLSVDSLDQATNQSIGRVTAGGSICQYEQPQEAISRIRNISDMVVKINTVVSAWNHAEDFSAFIQAVRPDRWKILRMLPVRGISGEVGDRQFHDFLVRHRQFSDIIAAEDNDQMTGSYVMVDPRSRFFWFDGRPGSGYRYSEPIAEVGAVEAWKSVNFDVFKFTARYESMALG